MTDCVVGVAEEGRTEWDGPSTPVPPALLYTPPPTLSGRDPHDPLYPPVRLDTPSPHSLLLPLALHQPINQIRKTLPNLQPVLIAHLLLVALSILARPDKEPPPDHTALEVALPVVSNDPRVRPLLAREARNRAEGGLEERWGWLANREDGGGREGGKGERLDEGSGTEGEETRGGLEVGGEMLEGRR